MGVGREWALSTNTGGIDMKIPIHTVSNVISDVADRFVEGERYYRYLDKAVRNSILQQHSWEQMSARWSRCYQYRREGECNGECEICSELSEHEQHVDAVLSVLYVIYLKALGAEEGMEKFAELLRSMAARK